MVKIMLDAGHGKGSAYNRGSHFGNEGDNNFKFSLYLKKELENFGFEVGLTRPYEEIGSNEDLYRRGSLGSGYDLFLSLHTNAGGGTGVEIFNSNIKGDKTLASRLCAVLSDVQGIKNRGVKYKTLDGSSLDWYGVLRHNKAKTGMLIEHCFHDNYNECNWYYENMQTIAKTEAKCIAEYYGLVSASKWRKNEIGWWYSVGESYLKNCWRNIDGNWYYFDERGYAYQNKWHLYKNEWYYFGDDCKMLKNAWLDIDTERFFFNENGVCELNYVKEIDGKLYAFNSRGALIKDKKIDENGVIE